jgi:hypothetical protein
MSKRERDPFEVYREERILDILKDRSLTGSQVRLGVAIALDLNRKTGDAYPGEERLAERTHQNRRNLPRDLEGLKHHIEVISREAGAGRKTTHYRFKIASPVMHLDETRIASPVSSNCITGEQEMHHGRCTTAEDHRNTPDPGEEGGYRSATAPRASVQGILSPKEAIKAANHRCHDCDHHRQADTPCGGALVCLGLIPDGYSQLLYRYPPHGPAVDVTTACKKCEERETGEWPLGGIKNFIAKKKRDFAEWKAAKNQGSQWTPNQDTPTCSSCGSFQVEIIRIVPRISKNDDELPFSRPDVNNELPFGD